MACLTLVFLCLLLAHADAGNIPVGSIITGMVTVTTAFIGLQVTNNGVIGKFYRSELDDRCALPVKKDADAVPADSSAVPACSDTTHAYNDTVHACAKSIKNKNF
jgi:hypothetical protein